MVRCGGQDLAVALLCLGKTASTMQPQGLPKTFLDRVLSFAHMRIASLPVLQALAPTPESICVGSTRYDRFR